MTDLTATLARVLADTPRAGLPVLIGELERAKAEAFARLATPEPARETRELVDAAELARRLGLTEFGVRDRARRGLIPCVRAGRLVRFDPEEVLHALRHNRAFCAEKKPP